MKTFIKTVLLLVITFQCVAQTRDIQSQIKYHTEKAQNYLDKEKALSGYYSIDADGIKMYSSPQNKANHKTELTVSWSMIDCCFAKKTKLYSTKDLLDFYFKTGGFKLREREYPDGVYAKPYGPDAKKLEGIRIAIDPGHIANDFIMGDLEKKHIKIIGDSVNGIQDSIEIAEGILTFATAQLLKEKLEKEGAQVFLTRTEENCAFGKTFAQWKKDDLKTAVDSLFKIGELKASQKQYFLSSKANDRDIFRVIFRDLELAKRVELINKYKPDLTVVIHFNVDETNQGWEKCSSKNFNMAFVAGSFMKNDLSTKEKRFEFLRLLISDDLEKSIALSSAVVKQFEKELQVPTASIRDAKYLLEGCMPTSANGVYCRNLQLPRYIHSPVVYGETLFQDNINECKMLNEEVDKMKNKRIQQVAEAYFKGIMDYNKNKGIQ
ncbi:MAG TPA: N-acetylmuramoyl-L-alanine amidase [Bacteroidia bacterium]|jgi:N-acetylmuramoyl-L-alanine amidase